MLKSNPYATHKLKKGDGCCEPVSPLILGQIKQISVKKAFIASEGALFILQGIQYYLFFIQNSWFSTSYTFFPLRSTLSTLYKYIKIWKT